MEEEVAIRHGMGMEATKEVLEAVEEEEDPMEDSDLLQLQEVALNLQNRVL